MTMRRPPTRICKVLIDECHARPIRERLVEGRTPLHQSWISEWGLWPENGVWSPPAWLLITGIHPSDLRDVEAIRAYEQQYRRMGKVFQSATASGLTIPETLHHTVLLAEIHLERAKSYIQRREVKIIAPGYPEWAFLWLAWANVPWYCRWVDGDRSRKPMPFDEDEHVREAEQPVGDVHEPKRDSGAPEDVQEEWSGMDSDDDEESQG